MQKIFILFLLASCGASTGYAQNPIFSQRYTADPSGIEYEGRLYLFASHDPDDQFGRYKMDDITCISTADMVNWTDHGEVFKVPRDLRDSFATRSWAPSVVYSDTLKKFFLYFGDGNQSIGVASSDYPTGPFKDAKGKPMIDPGVLANYVEDPASNKKLWVFDPTVLLDDDGRAYCYFGGGIQFKNPTTDAERFFGRAIPMNADMISVRDSQDIIIKAPGFFEGAWVHTRRNDANEKIYYFSYFRNDTAGLKIDYLTSDNPLTDWQYRGTVMAEVPHNRAADGRGNNKHTGIFSFKDKWYIAYHNRKISLDRKIEKPIKLRSVCIEELTYTPEGEIIEVFATETGPGQVAYVDPYQRQEAEMMAGQSYLNPGIETEAIDHSPSERIVTDIDNGDWVKVRGVDFGDGATGFTAYARGLEGGTIGIHLDSLASPAIGEYTIKPGSAWGAASSAIERVSGIHDVYFRFVGNNGKLFEYDWWQFSAASK